MSIDQKVALASEAYEDYSLPTVLAALQLPRSTWYYHKSNGMSYTEKYHHLREPLEMIARQHPDLRWVQAYDTGALGDLWFPRQP